MPSAKISAHYTAALQVICLSKLARCGHTFALLRTGLACRPRSRTIPDWFAHL